MTSLSLWGFVRASSTRFTTCADALATALVSCMPAHNCTMPGGVRGRLFVVCKVAAYDFGLWRAPPVIRPKNSVAIAPNNTRDPAWPESAPLSLGRSVLCVVAGTPPSTEEVGLATLPKASVSLYTRAEWVLLLWQWV